MKDLKTEQFLNHGGWKWTYHERIPFSEIDIKTSQENPSRLLRRLDEDRAIGYSLLMDDKVEFPAIVLLALPPPDDEILSSPAFKYLIATGVHRVSAAQLANLIAFDAYVVTEPDQYRQEVLTRQLNTIEGQGVTTKDQIAQVLLLHETYPSHSLRTLAKEWSLKYGAVKMAHSEQQAMRRASRFGFEFSKSNKLSQKSLLALNTIHSDPVFQKSLHFVVMNGSTTNEVDELVRKIRKTRDDSAALAVVERYTEAAAQLKIKAKAKHGRISPAPATKFLGDARRLNAHFDKGIGQLHFTAYPHRELARVLIDDLIANLARARAEMERLDRIEATHRAHDTGQLMGLH